MRRTIFPTAVLVAAVALVAPALAAEPAAQWIAPLSEGVALPLPGDLAPELPSPAAGAGKV